MPTPMPQVRTRFAPSPTGSLHLGNLRVAVFNELFARKYGGAFVLRVEDTDLDRNVEGAIEGILDDLRWAGLGWDEGPDVGGPYAPYRQSERAASHRSAALRLLEERSAYLCFCSEEEMEAAREDNPYAPGCPGGCRTAAPEDAEQRREAGEGAAIRFAVPDGPVSFEDEVRGSITWQGRDLGDFIILRADARATYNFAVVVDDVEMRISHVIRGSGHLSNTPKHALLFDALEAPRPIFAHLPTVLGSDRRKLSKRAGAEGLAALRADGVPPEAVVNYLSLLGWSAGDDREVLTREELIQAMDLGRIGASDTIMDEEKLKWVAQQHIARLPLETLVEELSTFVDRERFSLPADRLAQAVDAIRTRLTAYGEVNEHLGLLFPEEAHLEEGRRELAARRGTEDDSTPLLERALDELEKQEEWTAEALGERVREVGRAIGVRGAALFHPLRLALIGSRSGPDLGMVLAALGREETARRLRAALDEDA